MSEEQLIEKANRLFPFAEYLHEHIVRYNRIQYVRSVLMLQKSLVWGHLYA